MTAKQHVMHGRDHASGGADPIPGASVGAASTLVAMWAGVLPTSTGAGLVFRVPYAGDGTSLTFTLARAYARLESTVAGSVTFQFEHASGGDISFSGSTVTTVTVTAGHYEQETTSFSHAVGSGDLLRLSITAVSGTPTYHVELEGGE